MISSQTFLDLYNTHITFKSKIAKEVVKGEHESKFKRSSKEENVIHDNTSHNGRDGYCFKETGGSHNVTVYTK